MTKIKEKAISTYEDNYKKTVREEYSPNRRDVLNYLNKNSTIREQINEQIAMSKRNDLLKMHTYSIYQNQSDGRRATYFPDKRKKNGRVKRVRATREEIENLIVEFYRVKVQNPTIAEIFNEWNDRRLELKKIATSTYVRNQHIFKKHFDVLGEKKIGYVDVFDWCEFLEEQVPRFDMTAKAFANFKGIAKGIVQRARRLNYIEYTFSEIEAELDDEFNFRRIVKKDCEEVYDEDETKLLMNYLAESPDARNLAILLIFITGMRVGEVVSLKQEDLRENTIFVNRTESSYKLNHKTYYEVKDFPKTAAGLRTVVIPSRYEWLYKAIRRINPFGEYVFIEKGERITGKMVRGRLESICKKVGILYRSPHKIRKTYVSILLDNNVDRRFVLDQVGHSCIEVSENYYHRNRKSIESKRDILDGIKEFG